MLSIGINSRERSSDVRARIPFAALCHACAHRRLEARLDECGDEMNRSSAADDRKRAYVRLENDFAE